jgi:hypothetical protein
MFHKEMAARENCWTTASVHGHASTSALTSALTSASTSVPVGCCCEISKQCHDTNVNLMNFFECWEAKNLYKVHL